MRHPEFKAQAAQRMATAEFEHMPWNDKEKEPAAILDTQEPQERRTWHEMRSIKKKKSDEKKKKKMIINEFNCELSKSKWS